jgi:hypothetical protein
MLPGVDHRLDTLARRGETAKLRGGLRGIEK